MGKLGSRKKNLSLEKSSELNSSRGDVCLPEKDLIKIMERRVRFGATAWMMGEGDMVTCAGQTQTTTPCSTCLLMNQTSPNTIGILRVLSVKMDTPLLQLLITRLFSSE